MFSEAKASVIGHIGSIETRGDDNNVLALSVATNESYKDGDGNKVEHTHWIRVVAFRKHLVNFGANYLAKGRYVRIVGSLRTNTWTTNGGDEVTTMEVVADEISTLDKKPQEDGASE